jgi:hypothetical protein
LSRISVNSKRAIKLSLASSALDDALIILITSSKLTEAIINPSKI